MKRAGWIVAGALSLLLAGPAWSAVSFTSPPKAERVGKAVKISFAVSEAADVEVAIIDAKGKVIRHLAAGVMGDNAPAPLAKGSLKQELTWDGADDAGQPAAGGPLAVRVSVGATPTFDKLIGEHPASLGGVRGFAVAPDGELFVMHCDGSIHPEDGSGFVSVFSREGKYLRTILPYPSTLTDAQLPGVRRITRADGRKVPFLYNAELRSVLPATGEWPLTQPVVTADGRFVFVGHQEVVGTQTRYNNTGLRRVVVINRDGSVPAGGPARTVLAKGRCAVDLAVSPDGKTFYATDIATTGKTGKTMHCVYRFSLDDETPTPFIGSADEAGAGPDRLNAPSSVDVDLAGNLYVADRGNDRIAVFKPDGGYLAEIKVPKPDRVAVAGRTGAIYVTVGVDDRTLLKFDSYKATAPSARREKMNYFTKGASRDETQLAVDGNADKPIIYYRTARSQWAGSFQVLRIVDEGASFGEAVDLTKLAGKGGVGTILMMTMDRTRNRLHIQGSVYDASNNTLDSGLGEVIRGGGIAGIGTKSGHGSVGLDGNFYVMGYLNWLKRLDGQLKTLPFANGDKTGRLIETDSGSMRLRARGVTADRAGNIYALWQKKDSVANKLSVYGPDGTLKNATLIDSDIRGISGVRLDAAGNIYLTIGARPRGKTLPDDLAGVEMFPPWKYGINSHEMNWYELLYGCIAKFPPSGGQIVKSADQGVPMEMGLPAKKTLIGVKGAQWVYFGASPGGNWRQPYPDTCDCESFQFDVDSYGRSFFPDAGLFRVTMLDTNGNLIGHFGDYGNVDETGAGSRIPLYWPYAVAADDQGTVYVGDRLNSRVVAVKLKYQASADCPLP